MGGITPGNYYTDEALKFRIESEDDDCYLEPYPIVAVSMAATFLADGKVKSCGGEGGEYYDDLSACYDYDPSTNTWSEAPHMPDTRVGLKSSHVEGAQWFLAGGGNYYGGSDPDIFSNVTSDVWDGEKFVAGPTLFGEYFEHQCQVALDPTHVFFADGNTGHTWILDWETQEYIQYESMRPKYRPGCGKIINGNGEIEVVVASDGTSEIFSFDSRTWRTGPDMPITAHSFAYDQIGDTFVLVGGRYDSSGGQDVNYDTVYQFDPLHYQWILKPYKLDPPRSYPAVLSVRRDAIQCP